VPIEVEDSIRIVEARAHTDGGATVGVFSVSIPEVPVTVRFAGEAPEARGATCAD
jgi:hypothetical protein